MALLSLWLPAVLSVYKQSVTSIIVVYVLYLFM